MHFAEEHRERRRSYCASAVDTMQSGMKKMRSKPKEIISDQNIAERKKNLVEKWEARCNRGKNKLLYSFLSVSKETDSFGVLNLPEEFVHKFGQTLPFMIGISCKNVLWCVDYDLQQNQLCGLNRFKKFYGLKILNMVQFDYVGDGLFIVRLFKDTAFECKYPIGKANEVDYGMDWEALNRAQYLVDTSTLDFEKAVSSLTFNACLQRTDYAYMLFVESDIDKSQGELMMSPMWEAYYKYWENGSYLVFKFLEKSWTIKVIKRGEVCYLGKGFLDFVSAAGMRDGDFLVAYRDKEGLHDCLRICIYPSVDHGLDLVTVLTDPKPQKWTKSFFKIVHEDVSASGAFMLPFLVNEFYRWNLLQIKILYVGGLDWGVKYKQSPGYIYNLEDMIRHFRLQKNETIIFTFNDSDVLYGRIYQSNGVEIDYQYRANHEHDDSTGDFIWSIAETTKSGGDEEYQLHDPMVEEDAAGIVHEFTTCLTAGNVDKKTHGLFIPESIKPASGVWKRRQKIKFITDKGVWDIGITNTPKKPRFTAGWNKFIRDNGYKAGQMLAFRLVEHDDYADFLISKI